MKKIFFLIYIFLNLSLAYSENIELKSREDVEIENLESQIKVLENNETEFLEKTSFYVAAVLYTDIVKILILLIISTMILI